MSNKSSGNRFEQDLAKVLAANGFWVHVLQQNKAGQPADIIAVKGAYHTLIDCKVVSAWREGFPFRRAEPNQRSAMSRFQARSIYQCYFAIRQPDGVILMFPFPSLLEHESLGRSKLPLREGFVPEGCIPLEEYLYEAALFSSSDMGDVPI